MATMPSLRLPALGQIRPQAEAGGDWGEDTLQEAFYSPRDAPDVLAK